MRTLCWLIGIIVNLSINTVYSQSTQRKAKFSLDGLIIGRDTGSVILWHYDNDNKEVEDTFKLNEGKFHFAGTVNRACEALIWTDIKNRNFDDPSVIRFLLESSRMYISYSVNDALNPIITGSKVQVEKESWDKVKLPLLTLRRNYYATIDSLSKLLKINPDVKFQDPINQIGCKIDSIRERIKIMDVRYINMHPNSYLSSYLLGQHERQISVDSVKMLYTKMANDIKKSSLGHLVLSYVYTLTDDYAFRKLNPLVDIEFDQSLRGIHSVYDLRFMDTLGNIVALSAFKGKYLLIDFWASWCKPCIANIPALNNMIKYYKSDFVQFISISMDYNINAWKLSLIKHNFIGVQLSDSVGFTSLPAIYCKVLWVPKYLIADPNGRIINYDSPWPGEPGLKTILNNLLKKSFPEANNLQRMPKVNNH